LSSSAAAFRWTIRIESSIAHVAHPKSCFVEAVIAATFIAQANVQKPGAPNHCGKLENVTGRRLLPS
jgi:hypothetical protein